MLGVAVHIQDCATVMSMIADWPFANGGTKPGVFVELRAPGSGLWGKCVLSDAAAAAAGRALNHSETVAALRARPPPEWVIHTSG